MGLPPSQAHPLNPNPLPGGEFSPDGFLSRSVLRGFWVGGTAAPKPEATSQIETR
jgi:hypothetical protein